jgi:hypothetical protein
MRCRALDKYPYFPEYRVMSWFHFTKQERLQQNRAARREVAEQAKRHAAENLFLIPHDITRALTTAIDEERTFQEYFGERMPNHVRDALKLEIAFWQHLQSAIEDVQTEKITDAAYAKLADNIRSFVVVLIDLLHAEEEMLTSCLQQHYVELLRTIQNRAAAVKL